MPAVTYRECGFGGEYLYLRGSERGMGKLVQCVDFIVFLRELLSRNIPAVAGLLLFGKRHRVRVRSTDDAVCNEKPDT